MLGLHPAVSGGVEPGSAEVQTEAKRSTHWSGLQVALLHWGEDVSLCMFVRVGEEACTLMCTCVCERETACV